MSLPSGYKRLEYIQSSGKQYIDTGFNPNQNTAIYVSAELTEKTIYPTIFGARNSNAQMYWMYNNGYNSFSTTFTAKINATENKFTSDFSGEQTYSVDSGIVKVGNSSISVEMGTFQSQYTMFLFGVNNADSLQYPAKMKLYSCKIYDNGTLVRDFVPCQNTDGEIGLWDDVSSLFYANSGTGTFTAGPIVIAIPDPPSNLHQSMSVRLAWASVSDAERYNIYRDGTLIASTTDLFYVDDKAAENTEYTYGVSAVNSAGESPKTTMTVYTKSGYFLYKPVVESANFP